MADHHERVATTKSSIAVVVPSYNHAKFVGSCLRSIFRQSLAPSKLLVIDDGSTDDSPQVIESSLKDCPFACELIVRNNRGLPATLNQGLESTDGEYFAYLGSDDVWLEDFLAARLTLLQDRPSAVLGYGHAYFIDDQNRVVDCTADWAHYKDGDVKSMLLKTQAPMSPTVMYVRKHLALHRWNEAARLEDYELYLKLSLEGEFAFDPNVLSAWRQHGRNTSWNQDMMLDEHLTALRRVAPGFGLNDQDLDKLITAIRFSRAEDFLRVGEKKRALQLISENLSAPERPRLLKMLRRFIVPYPAVSWWQRRKRNKATARYGRLDV